MKGPIGQITSRLPAPRPGTPLWRPFQVLTRVNTLLFRITRGRVGGTYDGAPVLILHHRGARSGEPRETPLLYIADGDRVLLVASMGGMPRNPAWYHNLRAHPEVTVELPRGRRRMRARVAGPEEREELWPKAVAVWPAYADYQRRTERTIPVVVLEPIG